MSACHLKITHLYAPVAQLVEHRTFNAVVGGSSPLWRTSTKFVRKLVKQISQELTSIPILVSEGSNPSPSKYNLGGRGAYCTVTAGLTSSGKVQFLVSPV